MKESKIDRFRRVAEARANKIIKMIRLLGNCSETGVYEYTDAQVEYIFSALQSELDKAKRRFRKPLLGKHRFSLTDTNEFDDDRPLEPTIAIALPDGSYLRAVVYEDDHFPAINIYWDHVAEKLPNCSALQNTIPNGMKVRRSASVLMSQTRMKPNITRHIWQKGIRNHEFKSNKTNLVGGRGNGPDRTPKNHWQRCFLCSKIR